MMSESVELEKNHFAWQINWKICLFSLFFFPLMMLLGFWQLDRADEKRTIQQLVETQQALGQLTISRLETLQDIMQDGTVSFRKVTLNGQFLAEYTWLLENQVLNGRLGVHVIQPFLLSDGNAVLVNRGWIPVTGDRSLKPTLPTPSEMMSISGRLITPTQNGLLSDAAIEVHWPRYILQVDVDNLTSQLPFKLGSVLLQLDGENPAAFQTLWRDVSMPASKHMGYAVQWFTMAFVLFVLTIIANSNLHLFIKSKLLGK